MLGLNTKQFILEYCNGSYKTVSEINALTEEEGAKISNKIVDMLYKDALTKFQGIDVQDIPESQGDITKVSEYKNLVQSLQLLRELSTAGTPQQFKELDIVQEALSNMIKYKNEFQLCYKQNMNIPVMMYDMLTLAIISTTSYLISVAVEYVKNPSTMTMTAALDTSKLNNSNKILLIKNLERFNTSVKNGTINKFFDMTLKSAKNNLFGVDDVTGIVIVMGVTIMIIPLIRELVYQLYFLRAKVSDFLKVQSDFLEYNKNQLSLNSEMNKSKRNSTYKKQEMIVDKLRSLSNFIYSDINVSNKKSESELKKMKIDDNDINKELIGLEIM